MTQAIEMLVVDDDRSTVDSLTALIRASFFGRIAVTGMSDPLAARRWIDENGPDLVLTDLEMPGIYGFDILKAAKSRNLCCQVIVYSSRLSSDMLRLALKFGACDFVSKTDNVQELLQTLGHACDRIIRWEEELEEAEPSHPVALTLIR